MVDPIAPAAYAYHFYCGTAPNRRKRCAPSSVIPVISAILDWEPIVSASSNSGAMKSASLGLAFYSATVLIDRRAITERFIISGTDIFVFTDAKTSLIEARDLARFSRSASIASEDLGSGISKIFLLIYSCEMESGAVGPPAGRA